MGFKGKIAIVLFIIPTMGSGQISAGGSSQKEKWFYGGGVGFGVGQDVQYFELIPLVGRHLNERIAVGVQLIYRYRKDSTINPTLTTNDYGATLFGRYRLNNTVFVQAEYEYLDYEFYRILPGNVFEKQNASFSSSMLGGGFLQPLGEKTKFYGTVLYNFNYDDQNSPYADPWVIRFGIGVGF